MEDKCVVVYSRRHEDKVVCVAVLQSGDVSDSEARDSQVFAFVCSVNYEEDPLLSDLVRAGGTRVVESLTPLQLTVSAVCQLPVLPEVQGKNMDKELFQLYVDGWVGRCEVDFKAIAVSVISQARTLESLGTTEIRNWPSELIGETLVAGCFGAWALAHFNISSVLHMPRSVAFRRPIVRVFEKLMPLVGGLYNSVKIYGDALGFGGPKAHKDVRTYRETVRRMEAEYFG